MTESCGFLSKLYKKQILSDEDVRLLREWCEARGVDYGDFVAGVHERYVSQAEADEVSDRHARWCRSGMKSDCRCAQAMWRGQLLFDLRFARRDLREADFAGVFLEGVKFLDTDLRNSKFYGSLMTDVEFRNADLRGAVFSGAMLSNTRFTGCRMGFVLRLVLLYRTLFGWIV